MVHTWMLFTSSQPVFMINKSTIILVQRKQIPDVISLSVFIFLFILLCRLCAVCILVYRKKEMERF